MILLEHFTLLFPTRAARWGAGTALALIVLALLIEAVLVA